MKISIRCLDDLRISNAVEQFQNVQRLRLTNIFRCWASYNELFGLVVLESRQHVKIRLSASRVIQVALFGINCKKVKVDCFRGKVTPIVQDVVVLLGF